MEIAQQCYKKLIEMLKLLCNSVVGFSGGVRSLVHVSFLSKNEKVCWIIFNFSNRICCL